MEITRKSLITGKVRTRDLNVTQEQIDKWETGEYDSKTVFSNLSDGDREFFLTGCIEEDWTEF